VMGQASAMKTMLLLMKDYAEKRYAFNKKLKSHPLHIAGISDAEVLYRGILEFLCEEALLLGQLEVENDSLNEYRDNLLRILTPVGKMLSGIVGTKMLLDGAESFGGAGYMEDTRIFTIFADSFVNVIWEGASNVMSLDVLRCLYKEPKTMQAFFDAISSYISTVPAKLAPFAYQIKAVLADLNKYLSYVSTNPLFAETGAKQFSLTLGSIFVASLLLRHAAWSGLQEDIYTLQRWIELRPLNVLIFPTEVRVQQQKSIAFGSPTRINDKPHAHSKL